MSFIFTKSSVLLAAVALVLCTEPSAQLEVSGLKLKLLKGNESSAKQIDAGDTTNGESSSDSDSDLNELIQDEESLNKQQIMTIDQQAALKLIFEQDTSEAFENEMAEVDAMKRKKLGVARAKMDATQNALRGVRRFLGSGFRNRKNTKTNLDLEE